MTYLKMFISAIVFLTCTNFAQAQLIITEYIKVKSFKSGTNKQLIEDAVYSKGVRDVKWDSETQIFTISYEWRKTTIEEIMEKVDNVLAGIIQIEPMPTEPLKKNSTPTAAK